MSTTYQGMLTGKGLKFGIIVSRFNEFISVKLLEGAQDALLRHGADQDDVAIAWTPGAFEIPLVAQQMARKKRFDAIICLGAVIRGGTPHFEYIAGEVTRGMAKVALETGIPVINGIITAENLEQAIERAGTKMGNKGFEAARGAIEMANLMRDLAKTSSRSPKE